MTRSLKRKRAIGLGAVALVADVNRGGPVRQHASKSINRHRLLFFNLTLLVVFSALNISSSIAQQSSQMQINGEPKSSSFVSKDSRGASQNDRVSLDQAVAIHICRRLVAAERLFYISNANGYTQDILSDPGHHNGLYWDRNDREQLSPLEQALPLAVADGFIQAQAEALIPYHGYYFRSLGSKAGITSGDTNPGEAAARFVFIAYPMEYRSSGVMTFIVSEDGVVYQKDLGEKTILAGRDIEEYYADASWKMVTPQRLDYTSKLQWQVGTIIGVKSYQARTATPERHIYAVSIKVGNTVYVTLCRPRYDSGAFVFDTGRELNILVEEDIIVFNDMLGTALQVPILSRSTTTP